MKNFDKFVICFGQITKWFKHITQIFMYNYNCCLMIMYFVPTRK